MRIFIIRHSETDFNSAGTIQGNMDSMLTPLGKTQAALLSKELGAAPLDSVFSSTLNRTYQTALYIAKPRRLPVIRVPALNERNYGVLEGTPLQKAKREHPEYFSDFHSLDLEAKPEGGESINEVSERVLGFIGRLKASFQKKTVAIVAHGIVNKVIIAHLLDGNLSKMGSYKQANACINELIMENGKATAIRLNYTRHLSQAQ